MTDEQVLQKYEELVKRFGDKLPNPLHYPRIFQHYVKLHKYYEARDGDKI